VQELEGISLHGWQKRCLDAWTANGFCGTVSVATGAGKTVLALAAIKQLWDGPIFSTGQQLSVKIIVPRLFLAQQWRREAIRLLGILPARIGLYQGTQKCDPSLPFVIYVLDSARHNIARHIIADVSLQRSVFLICDEIHHFGSSENVRVFDFIAHIHPSYYFALGLSATPLCEHFYDRIAPAVGNIIFEYDLDSAGKQGITADYHLFRVAVALNPEERDRYDELTETMSRLNAQLAARCPELKGLRGQEFFIGLRRLASQGSKMAPLARNLLALILKRRTVVVLAAARIDCAVDLLSRLPLNTRTILFSERIRAADELFERLNAFYPGRVVRYHSSMEPEARQRALDAYRTGEKPVIVCCRALDEGLDVPSTDVGIIASSGTNLRQRIQRMGRILRKDGTGRLKRIFYLFVPSTSETPELLWAADAAVDVGAGAAAEVSQKSTARPEGTDLCYDAGARHLVNPEYDALAAKVMADLENKGASSRQLATALRQLRRGAVATDYLMDEGECQALLGTAVREEKAYLQTMLLLIRASAQELFLKEL
jgi:superfamily II DNA or RNA helicase